MHKFTLKFKRRCWTNEQLGVVIKSKFSFVKHMELVISKATSRGYAQIWPTHTQSRAYISRSCGLACSTSGNVVLTTFFSLEYFVPDLPFIFASLDLRASSWWFQRTEKASGDSTTTMGPRKIRATHINCNVQFKAYFHELSRQVICFMWISSIIFQLICVELEKSLFVFF